MNVFSTWTALIVQYAILTYRCAISFFNVEVNQRVRDTWKFSGTSEVTDTSCQQITG